MKNYKVGQILYMTSVKSLNIIPVQVVEEVVRTTLSGKEKTYMILLPDAEQTIVDIKDVKGLLFVTPREVKEYMLKNTENAIDEILKKANAIKAEAFRVPEQKKEEKQKTSSVNNNLKVTDFNNLSTPNGNISVDLGTGVKAKINIKEIEKATQV